MKKKGFTLIELIGVLVILAIIALIVTPLIMSIIRKAKDSARKRSIDAYGRSVELAITSYLLDTGKIPTNEQLPYLQIEYSGSNVVCNVMAMKENGGLYLSECKVNNIDVTSETDDGYYHYGELAKTAVQELLAKANDISITNYTDGDIKEIYTFNHPATEQTSALTDYRYIGDNPYNYVIFNNELWRIIGVFTVEDENGNTEQKIKIVRNERLSNGMQWDSNNSNEWTTSTLNTYLNGDYYNGLDKTSKVMITDSRYYLGGGAANNTTHYGTAKDIYLWERGITVYSGRSINWSGKIALMYPSDYSYTYALGVDNVCYTDIRICQADTEGTPSNGWIYNISYNANQWLLSPGSSRGNGAFSVNGTVFVFNDLVNYSTSVHPTLYLSSSVKITSGTGKSDDPYNLSL